MRWAFIYIFFFFAIPIPILHFKVNVKDSDGGSKGMREVPRKFSMTMDKKVNHICLMRMSSPMVRVYGTSDVEDAEETEFANGDVTDREEEPEISSDEQADPLSIERGDSQIFLP